ncbi:hypothetical protein WICPIJ_001841 [Wickerhamomyces pijperi]|uniref:V-type proton ATPase subunit S1/VOA1 transmembrane domain-containing protein n=1 Tax=Wickerhamomyces pijperi TaxID=599730 RepID=A0A9P8QA23_WICPI|nr:hypothetical protein WICPIJ_001841 [Wickerhamomyces pijperi]
MSNPLIELQQTAVNSTSTQLWTPALISTLLVSLILFAILSVAISWMSSLDVSYEALERKQDGVKKAQ